MCSSWRATSIEDSSIKTNYHRDYLIIGKDISSILGVSYDKIQEIRDEDQEDNVRYIKEAFKDII